MSSSLASQDIARAVCEYFVTGVSFEQTSDGIVARLPVADHYGDPLELLVSWRDGALVLSDRGIAHQEIAIATHTHDPTSALWDRVHEIAHRRGLRFEDGELTVVTTDGREGMGAAVIALVEGITEALSLGRAFVAPASVPFTDEVAVFLRDHRVPYEAGVKVRGASSADHRTDFVLTNGGRHIAQAVASEQSMRRAVNIFYDVAEVGAFARPIAFVDDDATGYSTATFQQLAYKADVFTWSRREAFVEFWGGLRH